MRRFKLSAYVGFRADPETLRRLEELVEIRGVTVSQVVREAIHVYHSLLKGAGNVRLGGGVTIQVNSPVINIVSAKAEASAEAKAEAKVLRIAEELESYAAQLSAMKIYVDSASVARRIQSFARKLRAVQF